MGLIQISEGVERVLLLQRFRWCFVDRWSCSILEREERAESKVEEVKEERARVCASVAREDMLRLSLLLYATQCGSFFWLCLCLSLSL